MEQLRLAEIESRFAQIIWKNAPMTTRQLVALCADELNWARTTTYTVLKKLCDRGMAKMEHGLVTSLVTKDEFHAVISEKFVNRNFQGSLPAFVAAFTSRKELSAEEVAQIREMIDGYEG